MLKIGRGSAIFFMASGTGLYVTIETKLLGMDYFRSMCMASKQVDEESENITKFTIGAKHHNMLRKNCWVNGIQNPHPTNLIGDHSDNH